MFQILEEQDFVDLPDDPAHKWLALERCARSRLNRELTVESRYSRQWLLAQYVNVVAQLAEQFGIEDIPLYNEGITEIQFANFELKVSRAQARIWSSNPANYPLGRIKLPEDTKTKILRLSSEIELQINSLNEGEKRRVQLHARLEEFRREVNQPRTNIGQALSSLAQVSTIVALSTATIAQADEAYANILRLFGAAYAEANGTEIQLIEHEKIKLLSASEAPKQIEGPKVERSRPQ